MITVEQLIGILKQLPQNLEVYDSCLSPIEEVRISIWTHTSYPYNKPDKEVVVII